MGRGLSNDETLSAAGRHAGTATAQARPKVSSYCKTCLGPRNLKPLPTQEVISPGGVVHYGMEGGRTLCGKNATGATWWWAQKADTSERDDSEELCPRAQNGLKDFLTQKIQGQHNYVFQHGTTVELGTDSGYFCSYCGKEAPSGYGRSLR